MEGVLLPHDFWSIESPRDLALIEQAAWLDQQLGQVAHAVQRAMGSGWEPRLGLVWIRKGIGGPVLSPELLQRLAGWGVPLEVFHYDTDE
jgi:hypothetical protein